MSMTIGEVARRAGIAASAIRYYERSGLLPKAPRVGGRRAYDDDIVDRLAVIAFAQASGFTLREIRELLASGRPYSERLRADAQRKLVELDAIVARAEAMKALLREALRCNCSTLEECGRRLRGVPRARPMTRLSGRRSRR